MNSTGNQEVRLPSGDRYTGPLLDGKPHGQGVLLFLNGERYEGEFQQGKFHGQGTGTLRDGSKYVGGWANGVKHGQGTYSWPDGKTYVGDYVQGVEQGLGTLTLADGTRYQGGFMAGMNSFSHYAFGAVCQWMFQSLAGIDTEGPGFRKILIAPHPPSPEKEAQEGANPRPIDWVRAHYDSPCGRIESSWRRAGDRFTLDVTIPAGTTATVVLPTADLSGATESGKPLAEAEGVKRIDSPAGTTGESRLAIESGRYHFEMRLLP